jgi:hypothetical protein
MVCCVASVVALLLLLADVSVSMASKVQLNQKQLIVGKIANYAQKPISLIISGANDTIMTSHTGSFVFECDSSRCGDATVETELGVRVYAGDIRCGEYLSSFQISITWC